eukprot:Skav209006  [mRNA]  locus=scaffold2686:306093:306604:+ [translate_table: standard]
MVAAHDCGFAHDSRSLPGIPEPSCDTKLELSPNENYRFLHAEMAPDVATSCLECPQCPHQQILVTDCHPLTHSRKPTLLFSPLQKSK